MGLIVLDFAHIAYVLVTDSRGYFVNCPRVTCGQLMSCTCNRLYMAIVVTGAGYEENQFE